MRYSSGGERPALSMPFWADDCLGALGLDGIGVDVMTPTGGQGDSAYEVFRLAWPSTRTAAAASGIAEADLQCVDEGFANSTMVVGMTMFAVWGRAVS
jgi:hypothetical protein